MSFEEEREQLLHSILNRSYEIEAESNELGQEVTSEGDHFYLVDEEDRDIIMHRDAHFGGSFAIMLDAYRSAGRSAVVDTSVKRIESLALQEVALKQNIAPLLLTGADAEKVATVRRMYQELRDVCGQGTSGEPDIAVAIAELILVEEETSAEIAQVVGFGEKAAPYLIEVIESPHFRDPLFPGYGLTPLAAADALKQLKSVRAIPALFDMLRERTFDYEEAAISALRAIGKPAEEFLIKQLRSQPAGEVNERAAAALMDFDVPDEILQEAERVLQWPR